MKITGKLIIFVITFLALAASVSAGGGTPLHNATTGGIKDVTALIDQGADVNARDEYGKTPLHLAVARGRMDIAELLLAKGADVNAKDEIGGTPLSCVLSGSEKETEDIVELLLGKGAVANTQDVLKNTPLHKAAAYQTKHIAALLLAKGADVNANGPLGKTPLHEAVSGGKQDMVELLLAKGANLNTKNTFGQTPLYDAAHKGKKEIAELLLAKGADVNAKDKYGNTPLHAAASMGKKDVAELLLAKGADVNAKDTDGETPLHDAVDRENNKDIVELLLAKGADVNAKGKSSETMLYWARLRQKKDVVDLLEEHTLKQAFQQARSNPRAALVQFTAQIKDNPGDEGIRRLILKLAGEMKPAPAIPEEARKHFIEGSAIVKAAKNPAQQALAAQSFTEALKIAPWWGDAYYNLGVAQELAEKYDEAEQAFNFYLLSNPGAAEKREVQDRIYALAAKRKLLGAK